MVVTPQAEQEPPSPGEPILDLPRPGSASSAALPEDDNDDTSVKDVYRYGEAVYDY
jgi:hypothetical protein